MTRKPLTIPRTDVPATYGFTDRLIKRKVLDGELTHIHPSGERGPCYLLTAELDALLERSTMPKRKPAKKRG